MTIRYEINPPKINNNTNAHLERLEDRIEKISDFCDGFHITESVLGIPRIPPLEIAKKIKQKNSKFKITISIRTIDKTTDQVYSIINEVITNEIDGVLVLMGDPPIDYKPSSTLFPSAIVQELTKNAYKEKIEIFLSISNKPNFQKISKKINAVPNGFVTQVIQNYEEVERIYNHLNPKGFEIIPCILFPSNNNLRSAEFLKLDWSNYKENFTQYVNQIHNLTNDVLITSPNDFTGALDFFSSLNLD
tara:strand:+ start:1032 stop:1772 length:741 start_codon:yes stop_codon:yes gene_type:complete